MKHIQYQTQGTCSQLIDVTADDNDVIQQVYDDSGLLLSEQTAYRNLCQIGYTLHDDISVIEKG